MSGAGLAPALRMIIEEALHGQELRLRFSGSLDALTASGRDGLVDTLASHATPTVTLDLIAVTLIDSSGIAVIVSLYRRLRARGASVRVLRPWRDQPVSLLRTLGFDRALASPSPRTTTAGLRAHRSGARVWHLRAWSRSCNFERGDVFEAASPGRR